MIVYYYGGTSPTNRALEMRYSMHMYAPFPFSCFILLYRFLYLNEIEPVVCGKPVVFRSNDGHRQVRGYLVGRYPSMVPTGTFALEDLLHAADNHQWRDVDGYKTINHYRQDSGNKEE